MDVEGKRWPILQRLIIYNRIADKLLVFACLLCVINIFIWSRYFTYINPNRPEDRGGRCNSWSLLQKVETRESIRTFPPQTKGGHILVGGLILAGIFIIKKLVTHVRVIDPRKRLVIHVREIDPRNISDKLRLLSIFCTITQEYKIFDKSIAVIQVFCNPEGPTA